MNFRAAVAVRSARTVTAILRLFRRGATTLPGRVAIRICPDIIRQLADGETMITVTGTNGKTTTTHMISEMLENRGFTVITNVSGANLATGLASTLIEGLRIRKNARSSGKTVVHVLETDEAAFSKTAGSLMPRVAVVTNLFRDQLDRYGELSHTQAFLSRGLDEAADARILLNADDSLVASLAKGRENRVIFFGMDEAAMTRNTVTKAGTTGLGATTSDASYCQFCQTKYEYNARSFGHLGDFFCPSCGFSRTRPAFSVSYSEDNGEEGELSLSDVGFPVTLRYQEEEARIPLPIPGLHNFYNTLSAVAAVTLLGEILPGESKLSFSDAAASVSAVKPAFGRLEKIPVGDKSVCLLLVKNPVGLERALSFVSQAGDADGMYLLLNSNDADGKDISWIWDVDFESRAYPDKIFVSGERYGDMYLRLAYAGIDRDRITARPMESCGDLVDQALSSCGAGKCLYILPNYTAMLALREILVKRYGMKPFWK